MRTRPDPRRDCFPEPCDAKRERCIFSVRLPRIVRAASSSVVSECSFLVLGAFTDVAPSRGVSVRMRLGALPRVSAARGTPGRVLSTAAGPRSRPDHEASISSICSRTARATNHCRSIHKSSRWCRDSHTVVVTRTRRSRTSRGSSRPLEVACSSRP